MDSIEELKLMAEGSVSYPQFALMLLIAAILSRILMWHYEKYFPFVSRSQGMSKTLIAIPIITCLVITIVKSSLALSLGLVGALSIVRFRTPIKEPFELAYIFASIAIGLGLGAGQAIVTIIAISVLLLILTYLAKDSTLTSDSRYFIYLTSTLDSSKNKKSDTLQSITKIFGELGKDIDMRRMDYTDGKEHIAFAMNIKSTEEIIHLKNTLTDTFPNAEISIVDGQRVVPF